MGREIKYIAICLTFLMFAPFSADTFAARGPKNLHAGAVYVLRNQTSNTVAAFRRNANGMLTPAGELPTGGAGDTTPQHPYESNVPLASRRALILSNVH